MDSFGSEIWQVLSFQKAYLIGLSSIPSQKSLQPLYPLFHLSERFEWPDAFVRTERHDQYAAISAEVIEVDAAYRASYLLARRGRLD